MSNYEDVYHAVSINGCLIERPWDMNFIFGRGNPGKNLTRMDWIDMGLILLRERQRPSFRRDIASKIGSLRKVLGPKGIFSIETLFEPPEVDEELNNLVYSDLFNTYKVLLEVQTALQR